MRGLVHFIPIVTTLVAFPFAWVLYQHYRSRRSGLHMAWWALGVFLFGVGTLTEASVTLFGWSPFLFKSWYISGALLGGAPLAQGTVYLLMSRKVADRLSVLLVLAVVVASTFVILSPISMELVEPHRLTGRVMEWQWVRGFSPFINLYAVFFLVGGAILSALRYRTQPEMRGPFVGNVLIAVGAILPGIGGSFTRLGHTEVLYVTELLGILLIWAGYRFVRDGSRPARSSGSPLSPIGVANSGA